MPSTSWTSDPTDPQYVETLSTEGVVAAGGSVIPVGAVVNSVKVHGDWIAVATEHPDKVEHGWGSGVVSELPRPSSQMRSCSGTCWSSPLSIRS